MSKSKVQRLTGSLCLFYYDVIILTRLQAHTTDLHMQRWHLIKEIESMLADAVSSEGLTKEAFVTAKKR